MALPSDFQFSQASLQDYVECRRRFELRYLLQLQWPAPEAEPVEEHEQRAADGEAFHRLVHQHRLGIPAQALARTLAGVADSPLLEWWRAYLATPPPDLPARQYPERSLSAPLGDYRLIAKFDLLAMEPGRRSVIVDWKTGRRQSQSWLASRLQTRAYRYTLAQAGAQLNDGEAIAPEQIRMVYWFAVDPEHPETLRYDEAQFAADERYLAGLVADVAAAAEADDFPKTEDIRRCRFCSYRSLCARGVEAGSLDEEEAEDADMEPDFDWNAGFDFEQIAEIAF